MRMNGPSCGQIVAEQCRRDVRILRARQRACRSAARPKRTARLARKRRRPRIDGIAHFFAACIVSAARRIARADARIGAAAAEIAVIVVDVGVARASACRAAESTAAMIWPGLAIAALRHVLLDPRLLHRMQRRRAASAFDRRDLLPGRGLHRRRRTSAPPCRRACTVHAPHAPTPQPNFVPVSPSVSRSTHSSGIAGSPSCSYGLPLIVIASGATGVAECGFALAPGRRSGSFCMRFSERSRRDCRIRARKRTGGRMGSPRICVMTARQCREVATMPENARRAVRWISGRGCTARRA